MLLQSVTISLVPVSPVIAAVATFILQAETGGSMTSSQVFTVLAIFNALRASLSIMPLGIKVNTFSETRAFN